MLYKQASVIFILLTLAVNAATQQVNVDKLSSELVKEGKEGIYLFLPAASKETPRRVLTNNVAILKATGNERRFQPAGKFMAAASLPEFEKIAGRETIQYIRGLKKLRTDEEVWKYIQSHRDLNDYGILVTNMRFLQAMGRCYIDKETRTLPAGTLVKYKINILGSNSTDSMLDVNITIGKKPLIHTPKLSKVTEDDSTLIVEWTLPVAGNDDALNGEVWRKTGNLGKYRQVGYSMANKNERQATITYTWREKVKPGVQYYYYVIPTTLTGLAGPVSDTASAISRNFKNLPQPGTLTAVDTLNGIYLSWPAPEQPEYTTGIVIERSKEPQKGYEVMDTVTARATGYTDTRLLPNISYHYRIRLLSIRQQLSAPSAHASAMRSTAGLLPEAPEKVNTQAGDKSIRVSWTKSPYPEIAGYYIYRSSYEDPEWRLVSDLVKDTVFTDTSSLAGRVKYGYAVTAVNYDQVKSDFSEIAFAAITALQKPPAPVGIRGVDDGGRVLLAWVDMKQADEHVVLYNVYRKEIKSTEKATEGEWKPADLTRNGFVKVNEEPVAAATFTDAGMQPGKKYRYAVTAIDDLGVEGNTTGTFIIETPGLNLLPPAQVAARKTTKGIEITWDTNLQQGVQGYIIMRREPNGRAVQVGKTGKENTSFIDTTTTKGKLYFYSVKSTGVTVTSESSVEKGVRF